MVRIRLVRMGAKHKPTYRIMVADSRAANKGRFIDNIGHFNPRTEPETIVLKADRAMHWLAQGAQPSAAVLRLLKAEHIVDENGRLHREPAAEVVVEETPVAEEASAPATA